MSLEILSVLTFVEEKRSQGGRSDSKPHPTDLVLAFSSPGSAVDDPRACIEHVDIPGTRAVAVDGEVAAKRSRITPDPDGRFGLGDREGVGT